MEWVKLITLFHHEKDRVKTKIIDPILLTANDKLSSQWYDCFLLVNLNALALDNNLIHYQINLEHWLKDKQPLSAFINTLNAPWEQKQWYTNQIKLIENQIIQSTNNELFSLVVGAKQAPSWVLNYFKFLLKAYVEAILNLTFNSSIEELDALIIANIWDDILATWQKEIYGVKQSPLFDFNFWESHLHLTKKEFIELNKIVNQVNPAFSVLNFYLANWKIYHTDWTTNTNFDKVNKYEPNELKLAENKDKTLILEHVVDYLSWILLTTKLNVAIWETIQKLTFGYTDKTGSIIINRTLADIKANLASIWALDYEGKKRLQAYQLDLIFSHQFRPWSEWEALNPIATYENLKNDWVLYQKMYANITDNVINSDLWTKIPVVKPKVDENKEVKTGKAQSTPGMKKKASEKLEDKN